MTQSYIGVTLYIPVAIACVLHCSHYIFFLNPYRHFSLWAPSNIKYKVPSWCRSYGSWIYNYTYAIDAYHH